MFIFNWVCGFGLFDYVSVVIVHYVGFVYWLCFVLLLFMWVYIFYILVMFFCGGLRIVLLFFKKSSIS
jgi:hypothetical protein